MPIDYDALHGNQAAPGVPADGEYDARLDRAAVVETRSAEKIVTEWSSGNEHCSLHAALRRTSKRAGFHCRFEFCCSASFHTSGLVFF